MPTLFTLYNFLPSYVTPPYFSPSNMTPLSVLPSLTHTLRLIILTFIPYTLLLLASYCPFSVLSPSYLTSHTSPLYVCCTPYDFTLILIILAHHIFKLLILILLTQILYYLVLSSFVIDTLILDPIIHLAIILSTFSSSNFTFSYFSRSYFTLLYCCDTTRATTENNIMRSEREREEKYRPERKLSCVS
jgi:hypothetical protein